jgi:hypothetical protein
MCKMTRKATTWCEKTARGLARLVIRGNDMISAAELLKESSTVLPVQSSGITTTGLLGIIIMIIIITSWGRLASTLGAT